MRELDGRINTELRLLRKERRYYQQGDQELKDSVTSISHDLRTLLTAICGYLNLLKHEEKNDTGKLSTIVQTSKIKSSKVAMRVV